MRALLFTTAVVGAVIGSGITGASATQAYYGAERSPFGHGQPMHYRPLGGWSQSGRDHAYDRPLPPISGVLHAGREGRYGYPGGHAMRFARSGPSIYDVRHGEFHRERRREGVVFGSSYGSGYGYGGGYGDYASGGVPLDVRYGEPPLPVRESYDAGLPNYGGQGFVSGASPGCGGCGPVAYQQAGGYGGYGPAGGLGVYSPGAYGPGPRIIAIPAQYNVGYEHHGCGCASNSGLFGAIGGY